MIRLSFDQSQSAIWKFALDSLAKAAVPNQFWNNGIVNDTHDLQFRKISLC